MANFIGTDFPQLSCALVQMRYSIGENDCGHVLKGGTSGGKKMKERGNGKKEGKEKRGWGYVEGSSRTGGTMSKQKKLIHLSQTVTRNKLFYFNFFVIKLIRITAISIFK